MCVVDEACSSCVQVNYEITNLCRGCVARSCYMNCPKDAIQFKKNGQARIDHDTCISCGKCHQNCPYHAIVYIPIPCEEVCPVKAISKDEYGVEHIDESKCIYCGKCINACPFGAIFEISQVFDILQRLRNKEKMIAIVAFHPGTIQCTGGKCTERLRQWDLRRLWKSPRGDGNDPPGSGRTEGKAGRRTTVHDDQLLSVVCPAGRETYSTPEEIYLFNRFPMYYTTCLVKEKHPDAKVVFIYSCVAKRKEVKIIRQSTLR